MVHALEEIHRLLRLDGVLIDIHPYPQPPIIQVLKEKEVVFAQPKRDIEDENEDVLKADLALAEIVDRRIFEVERYEDFDFFSYAPSVPELRDFWDRYNEYESTPKEESRLAQEEAVYAKAEEIRLNIGEGARAAVHERTKIARLKPIRN